MYCLISYCILGINSFGPPFTFCQYSWYSSYRTILLQNRNVVVNCERPNWLNLTKKKEFDFCVACLERQDVNENLALFSKPLCMCSFLLLVLWRNGSASDSRSEGCVFESRRDHIITFYSRSLLRLYCNNEIIMWFLSLYRKY